MRASGREAVGPALWAGPWLSSVTGVQGADLGTGPRLTAFHPLVSGVQDHSCGRPAGRRGRGPRRPLQWGALGVGGAGSAGRRWGAAGSGGAETQVWGVTAFRVEDGSRTTGVRAIGGGLSSEEQQSPPQKPGGGQTGPGGSGEVGDSSLSGMVVPRALRLESESRRDIAPKHGPILPSF